MSFPLPAGPRPVRLPRLAAVLFLLTLLPLALGACRQAESAGASGETAEATLLVYVVVDQLRADLLDRYAPAFDGGLARLREESVRWENATYDHAQTSTSPGHATAVTGVHPHRHGLVGNSWEEQLDDGSWESVYALRDLASPIVGEPEMEGRGPANLYREGLPDWILARDTDSRVVSLSAKDRAAIAMAGRTRGEVYWHDGSLGRFLTSTYYRNDYPGWVADFNEGHLGGTWSDTVWASTVPKEYEMLSRSDTFPYEGDGVNTFFPHSAAREMVAAGLVGEEASNGLGSGLPEVPLNEWRTRGPFPDAATFALARVAVTELELGQRGRLDYLALALSQVDRVGHEYGPLSREQLDNVLRLDRELGAFMEFLDEAVGEGNWVLAFTADHGVIELPEAREELGSFGRRITPTELSTLVSRAEAAAEAAGSNSLARARAAAEAAREFEWVTDAFALEDLVAGEPSDSFGDFFRASWHPERRLGPLGRLNVGIRLGEGVYSGRYPTGSGHGSPYHYDRHVPFLIMGPGLTPEVRADRVSIVDLAPTLAKLLGIPSPDDLDGRVVLGDGD